MRYTVRMPVRVGKALDRLPRAVRGRMIRKLEVLEHDPRPADSEKMVGSDDLYRIRAGDWRIVYAVRDRELVVLVIRIGHRREIYR